MQVSDNYIFNSIYQYYLAKCEESGIELSVKAKLGEAPGIDQVDLTVLFSNILENAYNACRKITGQKPFIDLRVGPVGGSLVIIMKNSTTLITEKDTLTTAELQRLKENGHKSLGLQSVQSIVDARHGYVEYHCSGGVFSTKISIICAVKDTDDNREEKT